MIMLSRYYATLKDVKPEMASHVQAPACRQQPDALAFMICHAIAAAPLAPFIAACVRGTACFPPHYLRAMGLRHRIICH